MAAFKLPNGKISLARIGIDGRMYTTDGSLNSWGAWVDRGNAGSAPLTQITGLSRDASNAEFACVAADGKVYHRTWNTASGWTNWAQINANVMGAGRRVALVSRSSSTLNAVIVGTDRKVYHASKSAGAAWSAWSAVSGLTAAYNAQVGAVVRNSTTVEVFVSGSSGNNRVYSNSWASNGTWRGWTQLPSNL